MFIEYTIMQRHHQQFTVVASFVLFRPSSESESFRIKETPHNLLNVKIGRDLPIYIYIYIYPQIYMHFSSLFLSSLPVTCSACLVFLDYIITIIFEETYKLRNFSLYSFLHRRTTLSLSGPNISLHLPVFKS